jgi:cell division protease FtsH
MPPRQTPPPPTKARRKPGPVMPGGWIWLLMILIVLSWIFLSNVNPNRLEWSDFVKLAYDKEFDGRLKKVTFVGVERVDGEVDDKSKLPDDMSSHISKENKFSTVKPPIDDLELSKQLNKLSIEKGVKVDRTEEHFGWLTPLAVLLLPVVLLVGLFLFILPRIRDPLGGGFLSSYIKSPAKRYERTKMRVTFDDVADMQNAKSELQEVVDFLRSPEKFQKLGAQIPKGVLLVGPPGTGKTLLARAVAGEAGVPFFSISGSEFIQMFVGVGASRVRDMFKTAKENAPCLLFIDEIDAVGRMRGTGVGGGSDEREQTLNQILSEMDGFQPNESVIVIAATNRPDVLDAALLRPGRFDRHVTIDKPTWQGRLAILKVHTRNKPLADDVNLEQAARMTIGMTGADLRNLSNEAALLATREGKSKIDQSDFSKAYDRVLMGPKREEVLTPDGKKKTAYHEAGHTLVSWFEPEADAPQKVSIIPRGRALGVTIPGTDEDRYHHGEDYYKAQLAMLMGGRAADRLIYGQPYSGEENDLKQATRLARYMVTHWGMSDRLGPMAFRVGEEHMFLGKELQEPRDFSEGTAEVIDQEVQKFLIEAEQRAADILQTHHAELDRLVEALLQKEELMHNEIAAVVGLPKAGGQRPTETVFAPGAPKIEVRGAEQPAVT